MSKVRFLGVMMMVVALFAMGFSTAAQAEQTGKLAEVTARGNLICGVSGTLPGFSFLDPDTGEMSGFDADYCRALAAAIFGDGDAVEFVPLTAAERFTALQNGDVDVLFRNTTWTLSRDSDVGGDFGPTTFYDGQGIMIPVALQEELGIESLADLGGARVCSQSGTTTELNISDQMNALGLEFELIPQETSADSLTAFVDGACDVLTSDKSQLAALRSDTDNPADYVILPDTLSKEPLGPMWLEGDSQWGDVVSWTVFATFYAEELGITQANIGDFAGSEDPNISRFLGESGELGSFIGLPSTFAADVVAAVGNYGEIYDRHLTPLGITRDGSNNASYLNGGLIYAPAWR